MTETTLILSKRRFPRLREYLLQFSKTIKPMWRNLKHPFVLQRPSDVLMFLAMPWLMEIEVASLSADMQSRIEAHKREFRALGFKGEEIALKLEEIYRSDAHLPECCPTILQLAMHISRNFVYEAVQLLELPQGENAIGDLFERFSALTYEQGRFLVLPAPASETL